MLEKDGVGQRSGVRPLDAGVRSQKKLNVRCCRVSRKAAVSGVTPGPPELPAQPPRARANASALTRRIRSCIPLQPGCVADRSTPEWAGQATTSSRLEERSTHTP